MWNVLHLMGSCFRHISRHDNLNFDISNLTIGASYNYGLVDVGKVDNVSQELVGKSKNSVLSVYIGIRL
jgi:hypothetical protein